MKSTNLKKLVQADLPDLVSLRKRVLHPQGPVERVLYPEDKDASTLHLAFEDKGQMIACGSLIEDLEGLRVRGMAVDSSFRGKGLGSKILDEFIQEAQKRGASLIWCNARTRALPLYERKGFQKQGDEFDLPGGGPHYKLILKI